MLNVLVTGAAGFIGSHAAVALARRGHRVTACDLWPDDAAGPLRSGRVAALLMPAGIACERVDVSDAAALARLWDGRAFDVVLHLAAQAGVRRSLEAPMDFVQANLLGFANVLEACRQHSVPRLLYASSSSVYGERGEWGQGFSAIDSAGNDGFAETDRTDQPRSFYAATKMANELMAQAYAHQYGMRVLGLRFFTVYGPWGRPDMAVFDFARRMRGGQVLTVFGDGLLERDYTYVDDTVEAVMRLIDHDQPAAGAAVVNIGHATPVSVNRLIAGLEQALGCSARVEYAAKPRGDVTRTCADETQLRRFIKTWPHTPLDQGLGRFADWLRHGQAAR